MISALKKLARKNGEGKTRPAMPSGVSYMGQSLQRKFGRGVQYNMKIVIKGDRNTGKSTLLARFQGKAFKEEYIPTNEIEVCSINWNYRVADDVVKVEVWDVVDKGKRKKSDGDGLKLANDISENEDQVAGILDAEFLDVYKGTHGCIMLMDITKQWTFKYVERELPKIPKNIPVLILSNFLDMQEHRVIQRDEIAEFVKYFDRGENGANIQYGESCMKNGFGLKFIHKFFNIPFLKLQRETLEKQLETNKEDMEATLEELSFHRNTEEQDYDKFIAYMEKKSNEKNPSASPKILGNNLKSSPSAPPKSSTASLQSRTVTTSKPGPSKKSTAQSKTIDDFVPEDTIDSGFLEETDNGKSKKKTVQASSEDDSSNGSDNEKAGNPMVLGFQDISSDEEDDLPETRPQKSNTSFDVDIEITSDESEPEATAVVSPVVENNDVNDSSDAEKTTEIVKPVVKKVAGTKHDIVLNDEDNNFMDAWLDSPSTDPREVSVKSEKKDKNINKVRGNTHELDIFSASQLTPKNSSNTPGTVEDNSSSDIEEEKKKRHSEKKQKESEEGKPRHRSKHKHKKKSRTKDSNGEPGDLNEKKHKSKRKQKHREGKSREKVEGTGAEYESF